MVKPLQYRVFVLMFSLVFLSIPCIAFADISVSTFIDADSLNQGWPIKGTLEITHDADQKVDVGSATVDNKPLKISLLRELKISPESSLTVSIYQFTLPAQNKGSYTLSPISIKVNGKIYKSLATFYDVRGPKTIPSTKAGDSAESSLKLEAFIDGPKELYPGQKTKLVYRYIYQGNIALSKEVLPMLEAKGLQKIGRYEIVNKTEGNFSIFEISQLVQALQPGEFAWGPSSVEGVIYVEDASGDKQFTSKTLSSEAPSVKLIVNPFPLEGKPASFNGAFGQLTFQVTLTSPTKISVGDPISLDVAISGNTSNWDQVTLPELCCQPGFAGLFKLSDLPPIGKMQKESKHFAVSMNSLSSAVKSIPAIQFAYFEPESAQYKTLYSKPIAISVSPIQEISLTDQKSPEQKSYKSQETANEWLHIYRQLPDLDRVNMLPLESSDLNNKYLGSWWVLWLIPLSMLLLALQIKMKDFLEKRAKLTQVKSSQQIYEEMLKAPPASPLFFQLLKESFMLRLFEQGIIDTTDIALEDLPVDGTAGDIRAFLMRIDALRYTSAMTDDEIYPQALEEAKMQFNHRRILPQRSQRTQR